ncbi:MAG: hypothetical protein WBW33_37055 [Bryobacteraceae bacterium]
MSFTTSEKAVPAKNQSLVGTLGAHRATPDDEYVYTRETIVAVDEARERHIERVTAELRSVAEARAALPATETYLQPQFAAVVQRLAGLRSQERLLAHRRNELQAEVSAFRVESEKLGDLGPFLAAKLKPEMDQQKAALAKRSEELMKMIESNASQVKEGEAELKRIADEQFKRNREELAKLLSKVQALCVAMDANMIAAAGVGIQVRSHEARMFQFGAKYVTAPSGFIMQPGAGEWFDRWKRGEFINGVW